MSLSERIRAGQGERVASVERPVVLVAEESRPVGRTVVTRRALPRWLEREQEQLRAGRPAGKEVSSGPSL